MPVYFIYGFRWPRPGYTGIRAFTTLNNLEDCSSEYVQNESSKAAILQVFRDQHPHIMQHLEDKDKGRVLDFIEQYDPQDESSEDAASQPYAYVAAHVVIIAAGSGITSDVKEKEVGQNPDTVPPSTATAQPATVSAPAASIVHEPPKRASTTSSHPKATAAPLSLDVEDAISQGPGLDPDASKALAELRDKYAEGAKIGWWVVYNGDPERAVSDYEDDTESDSGDDSTARAEDDVPNTPPKTGPLSEANCLGQPLPSLIPPELKDVVVVKSVAEATARPQDPPLGQAEEKTLDPKSEQNPTRTEEVPLASPRSNKSGFTSNFSFPLRRKSSKVSMPQPKGDEVAADPATLKEINKKEGRRYKFFGGRSEKKTT